MPLYDYKCDKCGQVFEVRQNFSDPKLTTHEGCGGPLERLISAPALQFKGSGWYITDYAQKGKSGSESSGDGGGSSEKKADSEKSDTAAKSDTSTSTASSPSSTSSSKD